MCLNNEFSRDLLVGKASKPTVVNQVFLLHLGCPIQDNHDQDSDERSGQKDSGEDVEGCAGRISLQCRRYNGRRNARREGCN